MADEVRFYIGNAAADQMGGSGWFIGQFVPRELGLRHQTDVEIKWGVHPDGDRRAQPWAHGRATTIAILIRGSLRLSFHAADISWEAIGDTVVLSIRFPSVEVARAGRQGTDA
jgi:hypothetical protein